MAEDASGGFQVLFFLKGCGSVDGLFLKKCLSLVFLSNCSRDSVNSVCEEAWLGTKFRPKARTSSCGELNVFEDRLVMYLFLFSSLWVSFSVCLRAVFLAFLFLNCFGGFCVWRYFALLKEEEVLFSETLFERGEVGSVIQNV